MLRVVGGVAYALVTAFFVWSSDPIIGLALAATAFLWAVSPLFLPVRKTTQVRARLRRARDRRLHQGQRFA